MRRWSSSLTVAAVAGAVALSACGGGGGGGGAAGEPADVVARYFASKDDPQALCATLSRAFADSYGGRDRCAKVVVPSHNPDQHIDVRDVEREGDRATVVFHIEGAGTGQARVVREDGAWRLDHLTQAPEDEAERERETGEGEPAAEGARESDGR